MISPGVKLATLVSSALFGAVTVQHLALYVGVSITFGSIMAVGALSTAAKAWRERAEARDEEAKDLRGEKAELADKVDRLAEELSHRPDLRSLEQALREMRAQDAEEHRAIVGAVDRLMGAVTGALDRNTTALETLGKHVPWDEILSHNRPSRRRAS